MGEVDYQLALLLQHQFEQELKNKGECNSDLELARNLQEQFEKEADIEKPKQNLVYNEKKQKNPAKSLTDPSWEVIDPTPDIHVLFMAFNERFFWTKLLAVCVSWSKRMTSCAGICSYQGRGGMCSITLSEPLLKLRPRKDLIETLLHEMIHAYLFVTHNNRDRDGHGPEFHKHMYRINTEAGTNITVYHDFHDEVRLYKQHWWRCDGPCQKHKPYFGMVRRAMNRAPGPHDRWWGEHSRNCGGNFVKVKEPEKTQKKAAKSSTKENKTPNADIRKFLPQLNSTEISIPKNPPLHNNNVHTLTNVNSNSKISSVIPTKENNIFGFTNLNGTSTPRKGGKSGTNTRGALRNNSNTIVINKTQTTTKTDGTVSTQSKSKVSVTTVNDNVSTDSKTDYSVVRNHWVNKYSNNNGIKRSCSDGVESISKVPKMSTNSSTSSSVTLTNNETEGECPICSKKVSLTDINAHIDKCLETPDDNKKVCIICETKIPECDYERHVTICSEENFENDDVFEVKTDCTKCSFCNNDIPTNSYDNHLSTCLRNFVGDINKPKEKIVDVTCNNLEEKQCTLCEKYVPVAEYDLHAEKCLLKMYDDMDETYSNTKSKDEEVDCLACGKSILKSELGLHLEDCMSLSRVFDDADDPKEGTSKGCDDGGSKYNCPFCMSLVNEADMNAHINVCLDIKDCMTDCGKNRNMFVESLNCDEEF